MRLGYILHFDFQQIDQLLWAVMHLVGLQCAAIRSTEVLSAWCPIPGSDRIVVYGRTISPGLIQAWLIEKCQNFQQVMQELFFLCELNYTSVAVQWKLCLFSGHIADPIIIPVYSFPPVYLHLIYSVVPNDL